jgi:hypothetical protein
VSIQELEALVDRTRVELLDEPSGCGSHSGQIFENLIEQAVEGCPKRGV